MNKLRNAVLLLGFIFIAGCTSPVKIEGHIKHVGTGKPIPGVLVMEEESDTVFVADTLGYYVISRAKPGKHFIMFAAKGFYPQNVEFKANKKDTVYTIDVSLEPKPFEVLY